MLKTMQAAICQRRPCKPCCGGDCLFTHEQRATLPLFLRARQFFADVASSDACCAPRLPHSLIPTPLSSEIIPQRCLGMKPVSGSVLLVLAIIAVLLTKAQSTHPCGSGHGLWFSMHDGLGPENALLSAGLPRAASSVL